MRGPSNSGKPAHLKLDQYTALSPITDSPPPYSWTRVRALKPESGPGSTSLMAPSGDLPGCSGHQDSSTSRVQRRQNSTTKQMPIGANT